MHSTKVSELALWCVEQDIAFTRFDYSGHGLSEGKSEEGTISQWLNEAETVLTDQTAAPQLLIGSSMGAWIALLLLKKLSLGELPTSVDIKALLLIAPAWDMTEKLIMKRLPAEAKTQIEEQGIYYTPSDYGDGPYPITQNLLNDAKQHLLEGTQITTDIPIRIIHGMKDEAVPWQNSLELMDIVKSDDVALTLIKDGDHRLSRKSDMDRMIGTIQTLLAK